jgi:hypothetical protein
LGIANNIKTILEIPSLIDGSFSARAPQFSNDVAELIFNQLHFLSRILQVCPQRFEILCQERALFSPAPLGRFYEDCIYELIRLRYPEAEIYRNVPCKHQGELDFVIATRDSFIHIEVSHKFYLFDPPKDFDPSAQVPMSYFVGPLKKDRLDLKYQKMFDVQLRRELPAELCDGDHKKLQRVGVLTGQLFYPWRAFVTCQWPKIPPQISGFHGRSWWITEWERERLQADGWSKYVVINLDKADWYSDVPTILARPECRETPRDSKVLSAPQYSVLIDPEGQRELSRGFIVPNQWPASSL